MAQKAEANVVYAAGVIQGITLVTFPAASVIFTDASEYALTRAAYGAMFVPQALAAITFSLGGAALARRVGSRHLYLAGLLANLVAMCLLVASSGVAGDGTAAYVVLLAATATLGAGFGLTVPAINTLTALLHPGKIDSSVLVLNALLGVGTALAPVLVAIFVGLGFWWGLPVTSTALLAALLVVSVRLPFAAGAAQPPSATAGRVGIPARFWVFAAFALAYGVAETMNGNWAQLDVSDDLGGSTTVASIALTAFWAGVTLGRVGFALVARWFPTRRTYRLLPLVLVVVFVGISRLPDGEPALAIAAFGLAGLGCSALLPLTISFGQHQLVAVSASVAGGVIAFYQLGYGIAAFGAGPLQHAGVDLPTLFGLTALVAAALWALSLVVTAGRAGPPWFHPLPRGAEHRIDLAAGPVAGGLPSSTRTRGATP